MSQHSKVAKTLPTKLDRVERRARQDSRCVFNNLGHIIDVELLRQCFMGLDGNKATGIDGINKDTYGRGLENNLKRLLGEIRNGSYHPKPSRIVEIPKVDGSKRPLAISCFEDKIVQEAARRVLERIFEPRFLDCSYGFRPGRNAHQALAAVTRNTMDRKRCRALVDIDLRKYFNTIPHEPLVKILRFKISDERFLHLIIKLLKAPTLDENGVARRNEVGCPQGSILSPLAANIYLHYVLDTWFEKENRMQLCGEGRMVRYADDVVFTFPSLMHANKFLDLISKRLGQCGLSINNEKTRVIICGPIVAEHHARQNDQMPSFTFLGFIHVWGKSRNEKQNKEFWRIKRRTCPKRFRAKLKEVTSYIKRNRHQKTLVPHMKLVTQGYLNYFAVTDNSSVATQKRPVVAGSKPATAHYGQKDHSEQLILI